MSRPKFGRCVALDENGARCRRKATMAERYHGNEQFYGYCSDRKGVSWVRVEFCDEHGGAPVRKRRPA